MDGKFAAKNFLEGMVKNRADVTMLRHKLFPVERQDDHPNAVVPAVQKMY